MNKDFAHVHISEGDYEKLQQACRIPGSFPESYTGWCSLVSQGEESAAAAGLSIAPVTVNVDFFLSWCRATAVHPCLPALRAFVIIEREGVRTGLASFGVTPPSGESTPPAS